MHFIIRADLILHKNEQKNPEFLKMLKFAISLDLISLKQYTMHFIIRANHILHKNKQKT